MVVEEETFYNVVGEEINRTNILNQMIGFYELLREVGDTKLTDFNEGSEIRNLLESVAVLGYFTMEDQNELSKIAFIDTAEGEWLDKHGNDPLRNLPRDTGNEAIGYVEFSIPDVSVDDITIPEETVVVCEETGLEYVTDNEIVLPVGETSCTVGVTCLTEGEDGNCAAGTINLINDDYLNIQELSVTNPEPLTDGSDYEEDDEYRDRLLAFERRNDFGSLPYYEELGNNVDGVHDVLLIDDPDNIFTKIVLVNGDTKPVSNDLLLDVLEVYSNLNDLVVKHTFNVDRPEYVVVNLTVNLDVDNELSEDEVRSVVQAVFDGGLPVVGMEFDGLSIGETLTRINLVSSLELFDGVTNVSIIETDTSEEIGDISVGSTEVLQLGTLAIHQTING